MYESPIRINFLEAQNMNQQVDDMIYAAVRQCDISVDKEELIKALLYDRHQYDIGFADGQRSYRWIPAEERLPAKGEDVEVYIAKDIISGKNRVAIDRMVTSTATDVPYWYTYTGRVLAWRKVPEPPKEET